MESHNHPCAVEPFNGAATGIGGIIRDVLAMNARPIALCNSLKFGGEKRITEGVVSGISDYGNCIGVPTVSTEVLQSECFCDDPLVNVTAIGLAKYDDIVLSKAKAGLKLMLVGADTLKDGLHGASFASENLTENKSDKLSIQIANPFLKKKLIEACLEIFSKKLVVACQDCGAAGILSSTSEVAFKSDIGVEIDLETVRIADKTISDFEIMLSETQERMLFVVEEDKISQIKEILDKFEIDFSLIGKTIDEKVYRVKKCNNLLGEIPTELLVTPPVAEKDFSEINEENNFKIKNINSPQIFEQYDNTVGNRTVLNPQNPPEFAEIWIFEENCYLGIYTFYAVIQKEPYKTVSQRLEDAIKFMKNKGYKPLGITNCLNFANPEIPPIMFEFKETIFAIKDVLEKNDIPICSGNVSFYNEGKNGKILNTPTFTMIG